MVLDENVKSFVMYVTSLSLSLMLIYLAREAQIASLIPKKVKILAKYSDFSNVFSKKKALVLLKLTKLNQYTIKLKSSK